MSIPKVISDYYTTRSDIETFNDLVALFDDLTGGNYDRVEPRAIARFLEAKFGRNNLTLRTFCLVAKRLGYEL